MGLRLKPIRIDPRPDPLSPSVLKGEFPASMGPEKVEGRMGISINILEDEFIILENNLTLASKVIKWSVARAIAYCSVDLLARAQPRVPVDTGELRESGRVSIGFGFYSALNIASGRKDGGVDANVSKITPDKLTKNVNQIRANIGYYKEGKLHGEPLDVAVWTHEVLEAYGDRPNPYKFTGTYYAKTKHTGPKYLELPWIEKIDEYLDIIEKAATTDSLKHIQQITKTIPKTGNYTVNLTKLVEGRISSIGYYDVALYGVG